MKQLQTHRLQSVPGREHFIGFTARHVAIASRFEASEVYVVDAPDLAKERRLEKREIVELCSAVSDELLSVEPGRLCVWDLSSPPPPSERIFSLPNTWKELKWVKRRMGQKVVAIATNCDVFIWDNDSRSLDCRIAVEGTEQPVSIVDSGNDMIVHSIQTKKTKVYIEKLIATSVRSGRRRVLLSNCEGFWPSFDGRKAVIRLSSSPSHYEVWDMTLCRSVAVMRLEKGLAPRFEFSADNTKIIQYCLSPLDPPRIQVWDAESGGELFGVENFRPSVVRCSPVSELVFAIQIPTENDPEQAVLFSTRNGEIVGSAEGHTGLNNFSHTFSPCGRWIGSVANEVSEMLQKSYYRHHTAPTPNGTLVLTDLSDLPPRVE